ncbi:c-type cytochrome [Nocardioides sp. WL0053]|uniref:Cytochrome bc1 complex cytochrome c subunit n=1 Tax=Nocardioides jiangsuensis TaxID=2866161 RepID=A0ABS7RFJ6_9ACTN|nr:c-type cytochrome [Nocardioides jiangsuensis]MBY9073806.1 c-type cytochrome [Nocardioides jiangsuensis]
MLSARLSSRRRSPLAGVVVLLLGLLVTGGAYALLSPATAQDSAAGDEALVSQGRELFLVGCASCHGKNAEGIVTQDGTQYGPSLVGVGAAAVDFQVSTGRMPMAQPGVQAPRKDRLYNEEETRQLAAYVASLGPGPAIPTAEQYDPETIPEEEREEAIVRGGEFFRTNCTACHNFAGSGGALPGGKYAPTLIGVEPKHVYEAMLTGPQQMPVFSDDVLKPEEKRDVIAYLQANEETPNYGGSALGSYGPVSEGMFAWLAGIGVLVGFAVWIAAHSTRSKKGVQQ